VMARMSPYPLESLQCPRWSRESWQTCR
jgi:hypothetical protein